MVAEVAGASKHLLFSVYGGMPAGLLQLTCEKAVLPIEITMKNVKKSLRKLIGFFISEE